MPRHEQVTTCRKSGGPTSKSCSCEHCSLAVCEICGGAEGTLTSDCPGIKVDADRQQEIFETPLDYTDDRGWHLAQGRRSPRFEPEIVGVPPRVDQRTVVAPSTDWAAVDRTLDLQHELAQKAIAWVMAEEVAEERSAALARTKEQADYLRGKTELNAHDQEVHARLERDKIDFGLADQRSQRCDDEFRQTARRLVAVLRGPRS